VGRASPSRNLKTRGQHSKLKIVNVVATAEIDQPVDLLKLAPVRGFLYDQAIYHCAYLKDRQTRAKVSIFSTGRMISIGATSIEEARHDLLHAARRLAKLGIIEKARLKVKLQNIVATGDIGKHIDLDELAKKLPNTIYEPEQFPGVIYYAKELEGASILIFSSGKVVFAGIKDYGALNTGKSVLDTMARLF